MRKKIKLSELISKMLKIEHTTGIRLDAYYLYDRNTRERITIENYQQHSDYEYIFNNCTRLDFSYND